MSQADNNEKRCVAHQIIHDLFEAKATGQIQLLLMACALSAKQLDPESYRKFIKHSFEMDSAPEAQPRSERANDTTGQA